MRILKTLLIICGIGIFVFASFLAYVSLTDLKPNEEENLSVHNNQLKSFPVKEEIAITTFNIGYAGLDGDQDFFADGGKGSRASNQYSVVENLDSIIGFLDSTEPDIVLLQEVDQDSSRSHNIDQVEILKDAYPNFSYSYGVNYKVPWVPVPLKNPMGKVLSGIMTLSKYNISHASRYQLPVEEKWPVKLFELDRCFTESQIITEDGRKLVLINLHLSAFDKGGIIRLQQLEYLKKHLEWEAAKGSYVIAGGDWNHNLPGSDPFVFESQEQWPFWLKNIPEDYGVKGYKWAIDPGYPTVRTLEKPYVDGYNFKAVIDGFLVSDNIDIVNVKTLDTGFVNTDHNPVTMVFSLE